LFHSLDGIYEFQEINRSDIIIADVLKVVINSSLRAKAYLLII